LSHYRSLHSKNNLLVYIISMSTEEIKPLEYPEKVTKLTIPIPLKPNPIDYSPTRLNDHGKTDPTYVHDMGEYKLYSSITRGELIREDEFVKYPEYTKYYENKTKYDAYKKRVVDIENYNKEIKNLVRLTSIHKGLTGWGINLHGNNIYYNIQPHQARVEILGIYTGYDDFELNGFMVTKHKFTDGEMYEFNKGRTSNKFSEEIQDKNIDEYLCIIKNLGGSRKIRKNKTKGKYTSKKRQQKRKSHKKR